MEGPFPAYQGDDPYIFVSYAHDDAALVFPELTRIREAGFNVWYDEGIRPGSTWREEVALALTESKLFVYFLTDNSVRSENCQQELNFALSRERKVLAIHLTPVHLTAGIELSLSNKQAILKPEMDDASYAAKLLGAVRSMMPVVPIELPVSGSGTGANAKHESIAILPFANRSSDPENDYLCDGIVEELMIGLTRVDGLVVASQLQTYAFKNRTEDIREIGRKLKSLHVLTGSLQKAGPRIRVNVTLSETEQGTALWSERYDGTIDDVFELQEDVAAKVLDALKLRFTSGDVATRQNIIELGTSSSDAYQFFLLGRHEQGKGSRSGWLKARDYYSRALAEDPDFGRALYHDFLCLLNLRDAGHLPQDEALSAGKQHIDQIYASNFEPSFPRVWFERELEPSIFETLSLRDQLEELLSAFQEADSDWNGFEYFQAANLLSGAGLVNSACLFYEGYIERFPEYAANTGVHNPYTNTLSFLGRFEKAIDICTSVYTRQPSQVYMLSNRAMLYARTGQYRKAEDDLKELARTFPRNLAQLYDLYWRREMDAARELFDWLVSRKNLFPGLKAQACFLMEEIDRGFEIIRQSPPVPSMMPRLMRIGILHNLPGSTRQAVITHPEYQALLTEAGIDDEWQRDMMTAMNGIEHLTGIHVQLDEHF